MTRLSIALVVAVAWASQANAEPYFIGPLVRVDGGRSVGATLRGYSGETALLRGPDGDATVDPADTSCAPGGPRPGDSICLWVAPESPVMASVDGGASWTSETPQAAPSVATQAIVTDTPAPVTPYLLWILPQAPIVRYWRFQRCVVDLTGAPTPPVCSVYDTEPNVTRYCETIIRKGIAYWRCLRPVPQTQYLWRVAGGNDTGLAGYGGEQYAVAMWMDDAPASGQAPCWWPNPNGPCP